VNLFYQPGIPKGVGNLDHDESKHCARVLRKKSGDLIRITDGRGFFYDGRLTHVDAEACFFSIEQQIAEPPREFHIHIAISPTKSADRIEWFVEKAVELGIDKITLMQSTRTERAHIKSARLEKIAISAMKQSLKATLPVIREMQPLNQVIQAIDEQQRFIAYVNTSNPYHLQALATPGDSYAVLIGPEGDFTQDELQQATDQGFREVSLGSSRLRTETAGLAACHILNLINS